MILNFRRIDIEDNDGSLYSLDYMFREYRYLNIHEVYKMENRWTAQIETIVNGCSHYCDVNGCSKSDVLMGLKAMLKNMGIV